MRAVGEYTEFFHKLGSGVILGLGVIIPGVSGAVLAMVLGLYQPLIQAASEPFSDWRGKLRLFVPLGFGILICLLVFSRLLEYLFSHYPRPTLYLFLGLVVGGLPGIVQNAHKRGFRLSYLTSLALGVAMILFVSNLPSIITGLSFEQESLLSLIFQGLLLGAGLVIPGVSASFLLMAFGSYQYLLSALAQLHLAVLVPVGFGILPALILTSRFMNWLLHRVEGYTLYGILGLILGSIYQVFPGLPNSFGEIVLCFGLLAAGLWISLRLPKNYT